MATPGADQPSSTTSGHTGMPERYPEVRGGSAVPFAPKDRPQLTAEDLQRVLTKHRYGSAEPGKTTFRPDWSDQDIADAITETMVRPDKISRTGDKLTFERTINGELVRVHIRTDTDPPMFWTAYPPEGKIAT